MSTQRKIIYKYVGMEGARAILKNRTLRFARPSEMNDPFDIYIDDLFEISVAELFHRHRLEFVELLARKPQKFAEILGEDSAQMEFFSKLITTSPPEKRTELEALLTDRNIEALYPDTKALGEKLEAQRAGVVAQFQNAGIFCATRDRSNLLMWAHYADQHRGMVLGFRPDLDRDSYLRLLQPVVYTDSRPTFYGSIESIAVGIKPDEAAVRDLNRKLVYSKSTHWSYEAEERIYVPWEVAEGEAASYLPFYPQELAELYLGCRVTNASKLEICAAAKALNSEVIIYQARPAKGSYALEFDPVV